MPLSTFFVLLTGTTPTDNTRFVALIVMCVDMNSLSILNLASGRLGSIL